MSPEEQQIAIAEALGYTQEEPWLDGKDCWSHKDHPPHVGFDVIPDYLNDLNACREAEIGLLKNHPDLRAVYRRILIECVGSDGLYWMSTAPQRCEAFLRTIGKWVTA
jgi:hypothetical protein